MKTRKTIWAVTVVAAVSFAIASNTAGLSQEAARVVPKPKRIEDPVVSIAKGPDYNKTTLEALHLLGGLERLVSGKTVFIKPNVVGPSPSGAGRITDYRVVQAIIDECNRVGAKSIVVGEAPVESEKSAMTIAGYMRIKGAKVITTNVPKAQCYYLAPERSLVGKGFWLPKAYIDADVLIDVPILKTHYTAGVTLGLKNLGIGVPPIQVVGGSGWKSPLHDMGINKVIPDVVAIRRPDIVVIDGMVAGEGEGPTKPDPVKTELIIAGRDVVAVDAVGTIVMGFDPYKITHLVYAAAQGLGEIDISQVRVVGRKLADVQRSFAPPPPQGYPFISTTVVREIAEPVTVDGRFEEWEGAWVNRIVNPPQVLTESWKGYKDLSARTMVMHNRNHIYAAFSVNDDVLTSGDGVELMVSFDMPFEQNMDKARKTRNSKKDFILAVGYTAGEPAVTNTASGKVVEGALAAVARTDSGYAVEMAIPVASLGQKPLIPRDELWVDFGLIDVDKEGGPIANRAIWNSSFDRAGKPAQPRQYTRPSALGRALIDGLKLELGK